MTSKTRLQALIKEFRVEEVSHGLAEKPRLLGLRDARGRNWLHLTASVDIARKSDLDPQRSVQLAASLLDLGLDVNTPAFTEGAWEATPLWYAVGRGHNYALASFLLEVGSTAEHCLWAAAFDEDLAMLKLLVGAGASLEAVAEYETPLLGAVRYSKFKAVKFLLAAGSDPDFQDVHGMTALHYMLKKNSDSRHYDMFLEHGARGNIADRDGRTAAEIMARKRDPYFHRVAQSLAS
jgi:hypothetical protein|tara:strand:- start:1508 stop:2215 length:708 start_codon:yes stop_codon:yes gene_type:complete